jgi:hypothetical protein
MVARVSTLKQGYSYGQVCCQDRPGGDSNRYLSAGYSLPAA